MLRTCTTQSSRAVASCSKIAYAHTSAAARPHPVLGTKPGDNVTWQNCKLANIIVTKDQLASAAPISIPQMDGYALEMPQYLAHGIGRKEQKMLFEHIPALSQKAAFYRGGAKIHSDLSWMVTQEVGKQQMNELAKANTFARLIDLRNASAKGIAFENRRRCVEAFSASDKPNDTGRPEVQAAILTMRIRNLWEHMTKYRKDLGNKRGLRKLVHKRAKVLRYLKKLDRVRYDILLPRLGLEPESVEGELVV